MIKSGKRNGRRKKTAAVQDVVLLRRNFSLLTKAKQLRPSYFEAEKDHSRTQAESAQSNGSPPERAIHQRLGEHFANLCRKKSSSVTESQSQYKWALLSLAYSFTHTGYIGKTCQLNFRINLTTIAVSGFDIQKNVQCFLGYSNLFPAK